MDSSTSSSRSWLLSWLVFTVVTVGGLFLYEQALRERGFLPSVDLDEHLWSWHRMRASQAGDDALTLLGASRLLLDVSVDELESLFEGRSVHMLGLNGMYPMATLENLANDPGFTGTVVVSLTAQALEPQYWDMQKGYVDHYEDQFSFYLSFDAWLKSLYQSRFAFADSALSWPKLAEFYDANKRFKDPAYTTRERKLSIRADYEMVDAKALGRHFYDEKLQNYRSNPPSPPEAWLPQVDKLNKLIRKIIDRGGNVILVRLPTTNGHWELDQTYYPKADYWDRLAERAGAPAVHFLDVGGLAPFELPDTSHLDFRDRKPFTAVLFGDFPIEQDHHE